MSRLTKLVAARAPLADAFFGRLARNHFVEDCFFARLVAQDAAQSLNVLAR
jgi:hypothetical protein